MVKFSIGIPVFKGNFFRECIQSILKQTYDNYELIIVNDQSPDPIDDILKEFSNSRIKYFKNDENIGGKNLVNNWNKCLSKADGEFFILMGDDDEMEHNYLEEFNKLIEKYPDLDVYHCRTKIINEEGQSIELTPACPEFESVYENIWYRMSGFRLQYISDFVYRTKPLKFNGGFKYFPTAWFTDDVTAFIACGSKGIAHTNVPVFKYRRNQFSISSSGDLKLKLKASLILEKWFDDFLLKHPITNLTY